MEDTDEIERPVNEVLEVTPTVVGEVMNQGNTAREMQMMRASRGAHQRAMAEYSSLRPRSCVMHGTPARRAASIQS